MPNGKQNVLKQHHITGKGKNKTKGGKYCYKKTKNIIKNVSLKFCKFSVTVAIPVRLSANGIDHTNLIAAYTGFKLIGMIRTVYEKQNDKI